MFSISGDTSHSRSSSRQSVWGDQIPYLMNLWSGAQGLTNQTMQQARGLQGLGNQLQGAGMDFLGSLQNNPFMQQIQAQSTPNMGLVEQQVGDLSSLVGRNLRQNVLPGIQSQAIGLGGGGGARQGVAEGIAAQGAADAISRGATDLMSAEFDRANRSAIAGGGLLAQSALGGLQGLNSVFQQGMNPIMAQWSPMQSMAGILGSPVVLGRSSASSWRHAGSFGMGA